METKLKLVVSQEEIRKKIQELGNQISQDFQGEAVVFIGILKGAFIFLADLIRAVDLPEVEVDFVRLSSYGRSQTSSGEVRITKDIELPLEGKNVIVVEDIVDTGYTLKYFEKIIKLHKPKTIKVCCLIDKGERRKVEVNIDYVCFRVPKGFLVGYGLDSGEKYRNLPAIYEIL